jgi:hypothetical protein
MSETFTMQTTGWELALLAFAFYLAGAYTTLILSKQRDPDRRKEP